jgi:predicted nuclease of predicted toxin-antitoxin system
LKGIPPRVLLLQFGNIGNPALIRLFTTNQTQLEILYDQGAEMVLFSREKIIEYRQ